MSEKERAQEHLDSCASQNGYHGFPPWLAGLKLAVIAIGLLESMLAELQAINENGKSPLKKR